PLLFGSGLADQYRIARDILGFSDEELADLARASITACAAPDRADRLSQVDAWLREPGGQGDIVEIEITDEAERREVCGFPGQRAAPKDRKALHQIDRESLAAPPFGLMATAGADGTCDVSPKGDPPGFTHVIDDVTIVIPDRPGNKRVDGWRNVLANPHVGLIYLVPGRGDTLRINGRARLVREAPYFDAMAVKGHRPHIALGVHIEQIFFHCPERFMRSR